MRPQEGSGGGGVTAVKNESVREDGTKGVVQMVKDKKTRHVLRKGGSA